MAADQLYLDVSMSQKQFIEDVLPFFGYDTTGPKPDVVPVQFRFVTINPANDEQVIEDYVELMIYSSKEDETTLCQDQLDRIAIDENFRMIEKHYYQVGSKDSTDQPDGWEKKIFINT
jgi:hypothetical protein